MTRVGQAEPRLIAASRPRVYAFFGAFLLFASAAFMWGFTVDDALISVRYARNLADHGAYAINVGAPRTDGVTPLPWPFLLAVIARHTEALDVLFRAKALGLVCAGLVGARVGWKIGATSAAEVVKILAVVALATSLPVAAHVVSGMETCVALALVTFAATEDHEVARAVLAGVAAAFRPELLPWAFVLVALAAARRESRATWPRAALLVVLAGAPFFVCVIARLLAFGHAVPLAVAAKPSDAEHGLAYVGAAVVVSVGPIAACAPLAVLRGLREGRSIGPCVVVAALVHLVVVVIVGGDWMPYARLVAPIVPGLLVAACELESPRVVGALRVTVAAVVGAFFLVTAGSKGRDVMHDREALVARARDTLAPAKTIAALDIGWVSAASSAKLVDLAGLTDPEIAALRGGHTSKVIAPRILLDREVDVLLVYTTRNGAKLAAGEPVPLEGARAVEVRLLQSEVVQNRYRPTTFLPLGTQGAGYLVVERVGQMPETPR